jgi:hypothetical protein
MLARRGLRLKVALLRDTRRSLAKAVIESSGKVRQTPRRLNLALEQLERLLAPNGPG